MPTSAIFRLLMILLAFSTPLAISAQGIIITDATDNNGKVLWEFRKKVGDIPQHKPLTVEFQVKNLFDKPLILTDVQTNCHCTVADYTRTPIGKNETGYIKATYDAKLEGQFYKILVVTTNFDTDHPVMLAFEGTVVKQSTTDATLLQSSEASTKKRRLKD